MGVAFDLLVAAGAATMFEETGELIGMEHLMAARAATPALGRQEFILTYKSFEPLGPACLPV